MEEEIIEGENETETADQSEPEVETEVETETEQAEGEVETEQTTEPELDRNAIYADARRKAEAEMKHKYSAIDSMYADAFKDYKNPITGQPIRSAKDYYDALQAQQQLQTKRELEEKGLDPNIIENAVNNSPAIKAATQIIAEQRLKDVKIYLDKQVEEIGKIDPDIKTAQDIEQSERYPDILRYVNENHLSVVDAYKLVYADKLNSRRTNAVKQQVINNAKSQQHLTATEGGNGGDDLRDIPSGQLEQWRTWFPDKSMKELRVLYNNSLH